MKTTRKSYFVFLSTSYKIWGMIVFPMAILGITELFIYANRLGTEIAIPVFAGYVVAYEVLADYWSFGGICEKDIRSMEYMKTSLRGEHVLQHALIGDCIRRAFYLGILFLAITVQTGELSYVTAGFWADTVIVITLIITRHLNCTAMVQLAAGCLAGIVYGMICLGIKNLTTVFLAESALWPVSGVLMLLVNVCAVNHVVKCMRESYYERTVK